MKKFAIFVLLCILFGSAADNLNFCQVVFQAFAESMLEDGLPQEKVVIYDENNNFLIEKSAVEIGDIFVTKDFYEYKVVKVDGGKAYAKKVKKIEIPNIKRRKINKISPIINKKPTICLYCTHNDESYVPSDGYDSVYGKGGIHDVAAELQNELEKRDINVVFDQTLHIPHDSKAYTRSSVTAQSLANSYKPDALFDIHRDGVAKNYYFTQQNGQNLSKIRIVVGKSNPNFDQNYQTAQKMFVIGNSMYPWLFSDIYCGKGDYNQEIMPTALLFEMGTYLIEKEYVESSIPYLVDAIETTLFDSIEENGDIVVDEDAPSTDNNMASQKENKKVDNGDLIVAIVLPIALILGFAAIWFLSKREAKNAKN